MSGTMRPRDGYAKVLARLFEGGSAVGLSEARLIERFAESRDEAAFAALVDRHGPMVLGVCRRLLLDPDDADDAFQAVFLVLARKAGGLRRKERVANWLYGVARRVALEARKRPRATVADDAAVLDIDARRPSPLDPAAVASRREDDARLHEEVGRLPERYRVPVVVCYFEGRTHEEAAALLNWPIGTVKGRLARARDLLRARLERRGVTVPAAFLASALAAPELRAAVPSALASRAVAAGLAAGASPSAWMTAAALSTSVRALSEGAIQAMFYAQVKSLAIPATLAIGLLAAGAGLAAAGRDAPQGQAPDVETQAEPTAAPREDARELSPMEVAKLVGETAGAVTRTLKEGEVDYAYAHGDPNGAIRVNARVSDAVEGLIGDLRSASVAEPKGRALLDALADALAPVLELRKGKGMGGGFDFKNVETLADSYFVFDRSVQHARRQAEAEPDRRDQARERFRSTIASTLDYLRAPRDEGVPRSLLGAYADYLAAIDPFAEEPPAAGPGAADAAPKAPAEGRDVKAALESLWRIAGQYLESYGTVSQVRFTKGPDKEPLTGAELEKALEEAAARHRHRIKLLEEEVRGQADGDPLLVGLADYLSIPFEPMAKRAVANKGPDQTFAWISNTRGVVYQALKDVVGNGLNDPSAFMLDLFHERVDQKLKESIVQLQEQAERDEPARRLLTLYIDYLTAYLANDATITLKQAPPPEPALNVGNPAPVAERSPFDPEEPPASPEETRRKIAGMSAALANADQDPNSRKAYAALDKPTALRARDGATLGDVIEQVKNELKTDDGAPVPVYVDPKGLKEAGASLESPVTIDLEGAPLKFALRLALKQLDLAYCVRDGVLIVGSPEGIERELREAQAEMLGAHPDRFILDADGSIRPASMAQPGGMM